MSSNYETTLPLVLIGSKTTTGTRTSIEMESSYQAESATEATKTFKVAGYQKLNLDILYTMGATETGNSIEVKIEGSPDGINFYRIPVDTTDGPSGVSTLTQREFLFVGADGSTKDISIFLDIAYRYIRVSVKETGVVTNKGSVYVEATLSGE